MLLKICLLPLYGDGLNIRDWIYVEDHCRLLMWFCAKERGEIYNIGKLRMTNIAITHAILERLNKPKTLITFVKDVWDMTAGTRLPLIK
jgi:dTDP-glucose 4,6-dehydratase